MYAPGPFAILVIARRRGRERIGAVAKEEGILSQHSPAAEGTAAAGAVMVGAPTDTASDELLAFILNSLDEDKAEDVVSIDLRGRTEVADYMVVASGRSARQVAAISEKLTDRLKQQLGQRTRIEGKDQGDWVLIDCGDVVVHVFRPEVREFYQIEKMWMASSRDEGGRS